MILIKTMEILQVLETLIYWLILMRISRLSSESLTLWIHLIKSLKFTSYQRLIKWIKREIKLIRSRNFVITVIILSLIYVSVSLLKFHRPRMLAINSLTWAKIRVTRYWTLSLSYVKTLKEMKTCNLVWQTNSFLSMEALWIILI